MKTIFALLLGFLTLVATPQISAQPALATFKGNWWLGPKDTRTEISGNRGDGTSPPGRWFQISVNGSGPQGQIVAANVVVDGVEMANPFFVLGDVLVFAKKVTVTKSKASKVDTPMGFWTVIDPAKISGQTMSWMAYPEASTKIFIANFDSSREFVFQVGQGYYAGDCEGIKVIPVVDGKDLLDAKGATVSYGENNAFIAKGQKVEARFEGVCRAGRYLTGGLYLL